MAVDGHVYKPGRFLLHRDTTGAAVADNTTINDTNYPVSAAFSGESCISIWVVWTGTGGVTGNTIKIVPLVRDGINNLWYLTPEITLTKDTLKEVILYEAQQIFLRISDVSGTTATDIKVRVAMADPKYPE